MGKRKKIFDGNGCKLKKNDVEIGGIIKITVPGWSKAEIDDTELGNTEVKTAILAKLKKYNDLVITLKFHNQDEVLEGNAEYTIEFPGGVGKLVIWMDLKSIGDASVENDNGVSADLTFLVTNMNAKGVETKPVLTLGEVA